VGVKKATWAEKNPLQKSSKVHPWKRSLTLITYNRNR